MFRTLITERQDACQGPPSRNTIRSVQAAPSASVPPWWQLVAEVRAERGISQDDLAYEARKHGAPSTLTGSWIAAMKSGKRPLHADVLEGLAGALGIEPERFAEYRLARARDLLDEKVVGLDQALANLGHLVDVDGASTESPAEILERVGAALETRLGRELQRSRPSRARSSASKRASGNG